MIVELGRRIHDAIYKPPLAEGYIRTTDVPVAGKGYNTLPFVFDLVNLNNDPAVAFSSKSTVKIDNLPKDDDGSVTVQYLEKIDHAISFMTGDNSSSLGFHPILYFYTHSGAFQPAAFFAMMQLASGLAKGAKAKKFRDIRGKFENYIREHKSHISDIVHHYGSGNKSIGPIRAYYEALIDICLNGEDADISQELNGMEQFQFLFVQKPKAVKTKSGRGFSRTSKSAAFIQQSLESLTRCGICGGAVHANSIQIDHKERRREGGNNRASNAQVVHPICNSLKG